MEEKPVLDDWREEQPHSTDHYRKAWRFLLYAFGILAIMIARVSLLWLQTPSDAHSGFTWFREIPELLSIGIAGMWLFSGLGLLAVFRARNERPTDLGFALLVLIHLSVLMSSSILLYRLFLL